LPSASGSNPACLTSLPYGYGVDAQCCWRTFMLALSVVAYEANVAFSAPSAIRARSTSRATVPSMKPTDDVPNLSAVLAARSRYHCHVMRVLSVVWRATWYMAQ
jgi:hypothetical protein